MAPEIERPLGARETARSEGNERAEIQREA
jgi:hypothetical protein